MLLPTFSRGMWSREPTWAIRWARSRWTGVVLPRLRQVRGLDASDQEAVEVCWGGLRAGTPKGPASKNASRKSGATPAMLTFLRPVRWFLWWCCWRRTQCTLPLSFSWHFSSFLFFVFGEQGSRPHYDGRAPRDPAGYCRMGTGMSMSYNTSENQLPP